MLRLLSEGLTAAWATHSTRKQMATEHNTREPRNAAVSMESFLVLSGIGDDGVH